MRKLRGLGALAALMVVALIVWSATVWKSNFTRPDPLSLGLGHPFNASIAAPVEDIRAAFESARTKMVSRNALGNRWHVIAKVASWIAFLCATCVTSLAAWFGRDAGQEGENDAQALVAVRRKLGRYAWIAGVLAAVIAAGTAIADRAENEAATCYKSADAIQTLIGQTRKRIEEARSKDDIEDVLTEMTTTASRT